MKSTISAVLVGVVLVGGAVIFSNQAPSIPSEPTTTISNVTDNDGTQIIAITAKGGYSPKLTTAKADTKTILTVQTTGTFDCSATLNIPSLKYQTNLPPTGVTEIEIPPQPAGSTLEGMCGMGMYGFEIAFK